MEVKVSYSKPQLEAAVSFIARNNQHFLGQTDFIRNQIIEHMRQVALDPQGFMSGTMGYMLISEKEEEGIDRDCNICMFDIYVDPSLGVDHTAVEYVEEIISG